jgi:hypothetical protein
MLLDEVRKVSSPECKTWNSLSTLIPESAKKEIRLNHISLQRNHFCSFQNRHPSVRDLLFDYYQSFYNTT